MKIILSIFIFISIVTKSSASLFGDSSGNAKSSNYSLSTNNIQSEIEDLESQIARKKILLKSQKQQENSNELKKELEDLKKLVNDQNKRLRSDNPITQNIIINNSPVNTNKSTSKNSGVSDVAKNLFKNNNSSNNRKHRLSAGISFFSEYVTHNSNIMKSTTISYAYMGDALYLGGYYAKITGQTFEETWTYKNNNNSNNHHDVEISYDKAYGLKAGLNLIQEGSLTINPYVSYSMIKAYSSHKDENNSSTYDHKNKKDIEVRFQSIGADVYIEINQSIAINLGADYVYKVETSTNKYYAESIQTLDSNSLKHNGSKIGKFYGGLSIKF
jgi:hypothetical protein